MIIRQATIQDSISIQRLLAQLGYPNLDEVEVHQKIKRHSLENYHLLVGEIDHEVVSFISLHWFELLHIKGKLGRITAFCADEFFRSQGIGRRLLEAAENFLVKQGCTKIEVTSNIKRIRTHEFYLSRGYEEDSRRFTKYFK
jgi:GNAT superfamily N-acetyltransferase